MIGAQGVPSLEFIFTFLGGSFLTRTAGCIYNDWVDRPLDRKVKRCAIRPLAAGALGFTHAWGWIIFLLSLSLLILLRLPSTTYAWGGMSLILMVIYPWMKRFTRWPQVIMGMAFNMGLPMGYMCYQSTISYALGVLYASSVGWSVLYDTLYAYQDRDDDLKAGIKSATQILPHSPRLFLFLWLGAWYLGAVGFGLLIQGGEKFFLILSIPLLPMAWMLKKLNFSDPEACLSAFKKCLWLGIFETLALYSYYALS